MDTAESTVPEQTDDVNRPTTDSEELVKPESPDDYIDDEVPAENGRLIFAMRPLYRDCSMG